MHLQLMRICIILMHTRGDIMKMTLKEISEKTGLSVSVLSRVASGNGYVSEDKRVKAEQALIDYGYHRALPHAIGTHLMDDTILIVAGATGNTYEEIIQHLTAAAHKAGKHVLTAHTHYDSALEEEYLCFAQRLGVYGIVMLSIPEKASTIHLIRECRIPFVLVGRYLSSLPTDTVTQDSYEMGILAAKAFIKAGHTRIGYLGGHMESSITRDKQLGFTDQLRQHNLLLPPEWTAYGRLDYLSGAEYAHTLLSMDDAPTALFVSNDLMAIGLVDVLLRAGVRIPEDLSLICCDRTHSSDTYPIALDRLCVQNSDNFAKDYSATIMRLLNARHKDPSRPRRMVMFDATHLKGTTISAPRASASLLPH